MSVGRQLCIIPCGSAKIWDEIPNAGPTEAKNVYTGGFSRACQRYATANFEQWVILSAKYGFLFPEDIIPEPYNVSFNKPSAEIVSITTLREQARAKNLDAFKGIVVLGGKNYVDRAKVVFNKGQVLKFPLEHCKGIGYMLQWLANATPGSKVDADEFIVTGRPRQTNSKKEPGKEYSGKYLPLYEFLRNTSDRTVRLSYSEIERLLGFKLPASAYNHKAWWSNSFSHSQAHAWLNAGWYTELGYSSKDVTFERK